MSLYKITHTLCIMILFGYGRFSLQAHQLKYPYRTAVAFSTMTPTGYAHTPTFAVQQSIKDFAYAINKNLNQSMLFNAELVSNIKAMREYHLKPKPFAGSTGALYEVYTDDGVTINCTYFDRGSDTLLLIGGGFTNEREYMSPFIDMFPDYDVVLFDFRGHGYSEFSLGDPDTWPTNITKKNFGIDPDAVYFGVKEHLDVFAVVDGFKRLKTHVAGRAYKNVFGLGVCYGAFNFLKTASMFPKLFDKLILDGCWFSLPLFIDKIKRDLKTLFNPQVGGWSNHWFFGNKNVVAGAEYCARNIIGLKLGDISLLDYVANCKETPLLFFHGKDDYMVARNEFEQLWDAVQAKEKTVVLTSNPHVKNHWKEKELYKMISELFFQLPQAELVQHLQSLDTLVATYKNKLDVVASKVSSQK